MITVRTIETTSLGDRSYLAHDGEVAVVVDPQRDFDRVLDLARTEGVRITHVLETHIHNDYVTGGLALAAETGAAYHVNADDEVDFDRVPTHDGDVIAVGDTMRIRALHTPGHTHTHLSYVLEADGEHVAAFTGGSLLYGSTGRPDLLGPDHTDALVHAQWHSARRLAELPDETSLYPTHGFGSFCSATQEEGDSGTIGDERRTNPALTQAEEEYVAELLGALEDYPAYYVHMGPANASGPDAPDLSTPEPADPAELRRRIDAGEWVVDLRNRSAFAAGHVAGTVNFGIDGQFITYLGWLMPYDATVTLLGATPEDVEEAQRDMARIGLAGPAAQATGDPLQWSGGRELASYPTATFEDLASEISSRPEDERPVVLDVRRASEFDEAHIDGAVNLPIHTVLAHLDSVPRRPLWVHCAGGYRAGVVASLLDAHGFDVTAVDDSFDAAHDTDLPLVLAA